jgi:RNA polymerase sigma factor (sigma-70 family)
MSKTERLTSIETLSLAQLCVLQLQPRCETILDVGREDLNVALQKLGKEGFPLPASLTSRSLAWATAFNIEGSSSRTPTHVRGIRGYQDWWRPETKWSAIWAALTKSRSDVNPGTGSTLLRELAMSVACEQRDDWQPATARPVDVAEASRAFEFVYAQGRQKVLGDIAKKFGHRAGDPKGIADEAWSRVFCDYWSATARRRFLGLSRISTLVCQVAYYVSIDAMRNSNSFVAIDEIGGDEGSQRREALLPELGVWIDPSKQIEAEQLRNRLRECVGSLPARQRILAEMVWFRQIRAKEAADVLRVSQPAVSQHLAKARAAVRNCLQRSGFETPDS